MSLAFDHLVHFVHRTETAVERLREGGFHARAGGRHEHLGTVNALCYFDLSYVEFLAIEEPAVTERVQHIPTMRQLLGDLEKSEGPGVIAIRTNGIDALAERLRRQGLEVIGPLQGSRVRPDGGEIHWSLLLLEGDKEALPLPFFIQWEQSNEARRDELVQQQFIAPHPAGRLQLAYVGAVVADVDQTAADWSRWFGLPVGRAYVDYELNARCRKLALEGGNLILMSPLDGEGKAADVFRARGQRPFIVGLQGAAVPEKREVAGSLWHLF